MIKYYFQCKVFIVCLGLFLLAMEFLWIAIFITSVMWKFVHSNKSLVGAFFDYDTVYLIVLFVFQAVTGVLLVRSAGSIAKRLFPPRLQRCPACNYDLSESVESSCTECGCVIPEDWLPGRREDRADGDGVG